MNIKPMIKRLEGAMERNDLREKMLVLLEPASSIIQPSNSTESINLVVGYNGSPKSQTALDLTMWIAHQTRLVTQKEVIVQVVYVVDEKQIRHRSDIFNIAEFNPSSNPRHSLGFPNALTSRKSATSVLTKPKPQALAVPPTKTSLKSRRTKDTFRQSDWFEQADLILWQARCMAEEWRGSFNAHLRFGDVAMELRDVVESESATLLFLGCSYLNHPLVQQLGYNFPCSVLGIPTGLS